MICEICGGTQEMCEECTFEHLIALFEGREQRLMTDAKLKEKPEAQCFYCKNREMLPGGLMQCHKPDSNVDVKATYRPPEWVDPVFEKRGYPESYDPFHKKIFCKNFEWR